MIVEAMSSLRVSMQHQILSRDWFNKTQSFLKYLSTNSKPLYDSYARKHDYLRISLTERCNLRCQYCMPEEGILLTEPARNLNLNEIKRLSSLLVRSCGIKKIRLTGGEPTVDKKLVPFLEHLDKLRNDGLETVAMTTNGLTLKKHSDLYKNLGLDAINISLDTLNEQKFQLLTRRNGWNLVYQGLMSALKTEFRSIKLNCVVMRGINDGEILDFVDLARKYPLEVRFIEFMPFAGNKWTTNKMMSFKEMLEIIKVKIPGLEKVQLNDTNGVSKVFKESSMSGTIGFISSISDNFCSGCNRLRITSDGNLKVCLFGREETSLRDLIRNGATDTEIVKSIESSLYQKKRQHAGSSVLQQDVSRPMIKIGSRMYHSSRSGNEGESDGNFSHINDKAEVNMVNISSKAVVKRIARAEGRIFVGIKVLEKICDKSMKKGDIISVSKIAGIMAAKSTSKLIPLCHQVPLDHIEVSIVPCKQTESLIVTAFVEAHYNTGVEMESLVAVSISLMTLYDMCKSVNNSMVVSNIRLIEKSKKKLN